MFGELASAAVNAWQGSENRAAQERIAQQNIAYQKEFAQSGVQWRVQDAIKAGIHPLAALGAQTASFSPVSVGDRGAPQFSQMGQDLGRALKAAMTNEEREQHDAAQARKLELENKGLQNDVLKAQLASSVMRSATGGQLGPSMPSVRGVTVPIPRPGPERSPAGFPIKDDDIKQKEDVVPETKRFTFLGVPMKTAPWSADAQNIENRYGEFAGDVLGALNIPADIFHSIGQSGPWRAWEEYWNSRPGWGERLSGGDRSKYTRGRRNMRGGG